LSAADGSAASCAGRKTVSLSVCAKAETVEIAQQRHRRLSAVAIVGVEAGQHPGLEAGRIESFERFGRERRHQVADLGVGLRGHAHPVQHALLLRAIQLLQAVGKLLRRTVRGRGEQHLVEALFECVGEEFAAQESSK